MPHYKKTNNNLKSPLERIPRLTKLIYGTGDWGMASFNTIRQIFYPIFLTDVVGIRPGLASLAAFVGIIWDAVNDPLIGALSDRIKTRWGRRRPFLLIFSLPFGAAFILLWWTPPWQTQMALAAHVTLAYMLSDTLQTLVVMPFLSLTPEMTEDYDERTSLTTYRMLFNLMASLAAAAGAPEIVAIAPTPQQGYTLMSLIFGGLGALPFLAIFVIVRERKESIDKRQLSLHPALKHMWQNHPFRIATAIGLLNWVAFDLVALMIPFFLRYWIEGGIQQSQIPLPIIGTLTLESLVFLTLLTTAILCLPFWSYLAHHTDKRHVYIVGMLFWATVQTLIITVQPGQRVYILVLALLAGISVSTAHVIPEAIFPDVLEWDELQTGHRHEGLYYGFKTFIRKVTGAIAVFIALQTLGIFHYQIPPKSIPTFQQAPDTLLAIRILTGPLGAIILIAAILMTFLYPITRERHNRIRRLLHRRRAARTFTAPTEETTK